MCNRADLDALIAKLRQLDREDLIYVAGVVDHAATARGR